LLLRVLLYWVNLDLFRRADGGGYGCVQLVDKDPEKVVALFWGAINVGDRVDSAPKDMAIVMKQQNRAEEAAPRRLSRPSSPSAVDAPTRRRSQSTTSCSTSTRSLLGSEFSSQTHLSQRQYILNRLILNALGI
jgi:hypothetical protein